MKKTELLAPAGSMEALIAAVNAGCDAVYLGGKSFGARAYAGNFDHDEMIRAVEYCHARDVKVYVTVNTLIYQSEIEACLEYVDELISAHVDALLLQDFGLFMLLRSRYPDLELHASTQMHVHSVKGVRFLQSQGIKRVVLARETPLEVIRECCKEQAEIEVFVHGALCVSYSGQCLMSSLLKNRSGNRGECAQMCRMKYALKNTDTNETIQTKDPYLLSLKDLNSLAHVKELVEAGVSSLKIEGRMKRPEYVSLVVRCYRKALDAALNKQDYKISEDEIKELKKIFNRGFTQGYLHSDTGDIFNHFRPNHIGIEIGTVIGADKNRIRVKLSDSLVQTDGVRILSDRQDIGFIVNKIYKQGMLVKKADKKDVIELECREYVKIGSKLLKTSDSVQLLQLAESSKIKRLNPIDICFSAKLDQPLTITLSSGKHTVFVQSKELCTSAQKAPMSKQKLIERISKINDTPFTLGCIDGEVDDGLFISVFSINECRREALRLLLQKKLYRPDMQKEKSVSIQLPHQEAIPSLAIVKSQEQADALKDEAMLVAVSDAACIQKDHDTVLFSAYRANERGIAPPARHVLANSIADCLDAKDMIVSSALNITNAYAAAYFLMLGAKAVVLSDEISDEEADLLKRQLSKWGYRGKCGRLVYGRRELMISKYCVINAVLKDGTKKNCSLCRQHHYALQDLQQNEYPILSDDLCVSHILESAPVQRNAQADEFAVYRFTTENRQETENIVKRRKNYEN